MSIRSVIVIPLLAAVASAAFPSRPPAPAPVPPNEPARVQLADGRLTVTYGGTAIFEGTLSGDAGRSTFRTEVYHTADRIEQVALLFGDGRTPLEVKGTVRASEEAFPCEADRRDRRGAGPLIVRHVSGLSRSSLNRAVYDRRSDWVLSVDAGPAATVFPVAAGAQGNVFTLSARGHEIVLRFRPRFYQKHRGLPFFEPWTYRPWPGSVAGWISWFAFFDAVSEKDVVETAEVFSEVLGPFGCQYFQIDDGYQRGTGAPENWLIPNDKFPRGLKPLADFIKSKGLKPGLWTAATVSDKAFADAHPGWFVREPGGAPARGNWIGFPLDGSNAAALDAVVRPLYLGLMEQGWEYIKLDALRHLRYEGYNANRSHFERSKTDLVGAYRNYVRTVRDAIGRDRFLLGCWGIRPELTGLIDACRVGDDGFSYAGLAQYNSFNNVVWRNDPDHIELNEDGWRSTLVTTLTGSLFMLTDKPAVYRTPAVEPAKRTVPVLDTRPGQLYDVDASRSQLLGRADTEVSGSGPRPFDGGYTPACFLYQLEIDRPFENWTVLGRTGGDDQVIRFADLGLDAAREYYVFEFWSKRLLGSFRGSFLPGPIDPKLRSQAFCVRERRTVPQIIATSRHVTCGGPDLLQTSWDGTALSGKSLTVKGDPYVLYLTEPAGWSFGSLDVRGAKPGRTERESGLVRLSLSPEAGGEIAWTARYVRTTAGTGIPRPVEE
jgi:alpha-galactosidase